MVSGAFRRNAESNHRDSAPGSATIAKSRWAASCVKHASVEGKVPTNGREVSIMCRAIKTLHNFAPPATDEEIRASSLQFVRKLSGFTHPSKANEAAFNRAVEDVSHAAHHLLASLVSNAPPRDRAVEAEKARARARKRYVAVR
jgi:hypothetical protein